MAIEKVVLREGSSTLLEVAEHVIRAKRCVFITGAGISCSGGIPDFRSSDGLYEMISSKYPGIFRNGKDLFDANMLTCDSSRQGFYEFMGLLKEFISNAHPTATHRFLKKLHDIGKLVRVYTQNIDNLEERAGLAAEWVVDGVRFNAQVVQLHGTMRQLKCSSCTESFPFTMELCEVFKQGGAPSCPSCEAREHKRQLMGKRRHTVGILKPTIVLYGDAHPQGFQIGRIAARDEERADCLVIMGTSLKIPGVKGLIKRFARAVHKRGGKVILVNATDVARKEWEDVIDYEVVSTSDDWVSFVEKQLERNRSKPGRKKRRTRVAPMDEDDAAASSSSSSSSSSSASSRISSSDTVVSSPSPTSSPASLPSTGHRKPRKRVKARRSSGAPTSHDLDAVDVGEHRLWPRVGRSSTRAPARYAPGARVSDDLTRMSGAHIVKRIRTDEFGPTRKRPFDLPLEAARIIQRVKLAQTVREVRVADYMRRLALSNE